VPITISDLIVLKTEATAQRLRLHGDAGRLTGKVSVDAEILLELIEGYEKQEECDE
jgi:hypothetical protein